MKSGFINSASVLYDAALALLYPQSCAVCGVSVEARSDGVICGACWEKTHIFSAEDLVCWKCGVPAPGRRVTEDKLREVRCRRCDGESYTAARACGTYEGALRAHILALKREPHIPQRLTQLLFETQRREPLSNATLIVPVPLHEERLRERGFNQAGEIANALSKLSGLKVDEGSLVRVIHTERHRAGMDERARRESVENAFEVRRPRLVERENILLVDDVFTTGATVSSAARALKMAGAGDVFVLTIARPIDRRLDVKG